MIEIGNILTLDNNQDYLMLEVVELDDKKYAYAVRVLEDETPTDEFLIFEGIKADDGEYLKVVQDQELYNDLIEMFKDTVSEKLIDLPVDLDELYSDLREEA